MSRRLSCETCFILNIYLFLLTVGIVYRPTDKPVCSRININWLSKPQVVYHRVNRDAMVKFNLLHFASANNAKPVVRVTLEGGPACTAWPDCLRHVFPLQYELFIANISLIQLIITLLTVEIPDIHLANAGESLRATVPLRSVLSQQCVTQTSAVLKENASYSSDVTRTSWVQYPSVIRHHTQQPLYSK